MKWGIQLYQQTLESDSHKFAAPYNTRRHVRKHRILNETLLTINLHDQEYVQIPFDTEGQWVTALPTKMPWGKEQLLAASFLYYTFLKRS